MSDDMEILKSAGFNLDVLSPEQQEAVSRLSRDELETLAHPEGFPETSAFDVGGAPSSRSVGSRVATGPVRVIHSPAELTRFLAEPGAYDDAEKVKEVVARHGEAKDRAAALFEEWADLEMRIASRVARQLGWEQHAVDHDRYRRIDVPDL